MRIFWEKFRVVDEEDRRNIDELKGALEELEENNEKQSEKLMRIMSEKVIALEIKS
jgi:DNA-binding transcriptional regulator GbsR (MarR family)